MYHAETNSQGKKLNKIVLTRRRLSRLERQNSLKISIKQLKYESDTQTYYLSKQASFSPVVRCRLPGTALLQNDKAHSNEGYVKHFRN